MDQGRMGVARLGSLSVDAMALAARDNSNRQSPRGRTSSSSLVGFHFADPIQDDLTKALERLNEADNESKRSSVHVSPPAPRKLVSAHNSVSYWQGISPEETLRHILDYVHEKLVHTNELNGNVKVVLTYAGTDVWLLVPLSTSGAHQPRGRPVSGEAPDPLHAAKIASIHKDSERAIGRLLRVMDRMAAAMPEYGVASLVGTQVTYRVFGYEVRIEIEACAQSIRSFTATRRKDKPTVDTAGHENSKVELEVSPRRGKLGSRSEPRFALNDESVDLVDGDGSVPHTVTVTLPADD